MFTCQLDFTPYFPPIEYAPLSSQYMGQGLNKGEYTEWWLGLLGRHCYCFSDSFLYLLFLLMVITDNIFASFICASTFSKGSPSLFHLLFQKSYKRDSIPIPTSWRRKLSARSLTHLRIPIQQEDCNAESLQRWKYILLGCPLFLCGLKVTNDHETLRTTI